ncbi:Thioredoxin H2-2 [Zea mays]|uniref:Thioredoxin H-type 5 n=2 Tax=Zea mays TaxID=4577 RepID=B6T375_MAIZE|nr:thioredoxin H-type 5 [Zea mays]ACG31997.1 thioredoxin H-type 5 [Zea mays]ACG33627.1 thioredoxin H-type 5 [Zea mays]PWZ57136.1 Thioredoxin H2-2 [Zea mays]
MGSFFSTLVTPPPPAADDPNCAVVAAHSKATYDEQWAAHKSSSKLMVIDFSASWCGPCRFIEPAFKELASRFTDAIFIKVDVDELAEVARTWKVEAMPTFVLVKDGKEVGRVIGAKKDELERKIRMFVTSSSSS